ncbi:Uncharacterised protein [Candidatus Burarchaeum australiense]|nr:Uncharacterised protein [Candidatus Burarchaeum australiense]
MAADIRELTFDDILLLQRIDAETVVERFGSKINASFFEAANLLGTLKLKGFVDIEASPGLSKVWLTASGKSVLETAQRMGGEELGPLDVSVLQTVARGAKDARAAANMLNIRSSDLAFHLNKLLVQGFIDATVKMGKVSVVLTEKGFTKVGPALPPLPPSPAMPSGPGGQFVPAGGASGVLVPRKGGGMFSIFGSQRKPDARTGAGADRAPTIADELAPSEEHESGTPASPEEVMKRMKKSKAVYYGVQWMNKAAFYLAMLIIVAMIVYFAYMKG